MRVESISHPSGDELPLLLGYDGLPLVDPNEWILGKRGLAPATQMRLLREIVPFLEWCAIREIDPRKRLEKGQGFTEAEISGSLLELLRKPRGGSLRNAVSPAVLNSRLEATSTYLNWMVSTVLGRLCSDDVRCRKVERVQKLVTTWLSTASVSEPGKGNPAVKALDAGQQDFLERVLNPETGGIGQRLAVQWRNYVAVMIMLLCGVRAGELLTLRVQDVRFGAIPSITVVRRPPDPDDPRRPRPRVKKLGRTIPIDAPFASVMNRYIMEFREELVRRAKVDFPYLIVTDDGAPLSRPRLNAIFLEIRAKYPKELPEDLTPHSLRHTFSTELECDLAAAGMEEDRRARALALMRGDSSSDSQDPYIVREIQERAHRALGAYQRKVLRNPTSDEEGETS